MPEYRRIKQEGGTYFFTLVTFQRQKLFLVPDVMRLLLDTVEHVREMHPFEIIAYCVLPDHVHFLWQMPEDDTNYSMRIGVIKRRFSIQFISKYGDRLQKSDSQTRRREVTIWQRRFWEHLIRDEKDLNQHIDYIHYNPVKHGLVSKVRDWEISSFHNYVKEDIYSLDWGDSYYIDKKKYRFGE